MLIKLFFLIITPALSLYFLSKSEDLIKKLLVNYLKNNSDIEFRTFKPSNVNRSELKL